MQSRWLVCGVLLISWPSLVAAQINPIGGTEGRLMLVENRTVVLDESDVVFDDVTSLAFTDQGVMVIASSDDAQVLMFDASGIFLRRIGRRGMGPFEYQKPALVRTLDTSIFIWDAQALKLLEYSSEGDHIDEHIGFTKGIKNFEIAPDRRDIVFYTNPREPKDFVQIFEFASEAYGEAFGSSNIEHTLLSFRGDTGSFAREADLVVFVSPSRAVLLTVNLASGQYREIEIPGDDFDVADSPLENAAEIDANFGAVFKFIYTNSALLGVSQISDYFVALMEIGQYDPEDLNPIYGIDEQPTEDERRRLKLFFFSTSLELVDSIEIPAAVHDVIGLRMLGTRGGEIVFYIQEYDEDVKDAVKKLTFFSVRASN